MHFFKKKNLFFALVVLVYSIKLSTAEDLQ